MNVTKTMQITLEANPSDAPCCVKVVADDGRDILIQTDWDFPSVASVFGWSTSEVQKCPECGHIATVKDSRHFACAECTRIAKVCSHDGTDGTVDCKCGVKAGDFISAARQWIDDNDGATAEDPGYF